MNDPIYRLFDQCIQALRESRPRLALEILLDISRREIGPQAQELLKLLSDRAWRFEPPPLDTDASGLDDVGVVLLMNEGDPEAITRTIDSVVAARASSGRTIHCLIFETLPPPTDVDSLPYAGIAPLPANVNEALRAGLVDCMLDFGTTRKALRRAIRCSRGRRICLLREGDGLWIDASADGEGAWPESLDVMLGMPSDTVEVCNRLRAVFAASSGIRAIPALLTVSVIYDGALLVDRDYLDDLLGVVEYDADSGFFGYLNEVLTLSLARKSGKLGSLPGIGCRAADTNKSRHEDRISSYTLYTVAERRRSPQNWIEPLSDSLLGAVLELARAAWLGEQLPSYSVESSEDGLQAAREGRLPPQAIDLVCWYAQQIRHALLGDPGPLAAFPAPGLSGQTQPPTLSFIASLFQGQRLVHSYLANITSQTVFGTSELIVVSPQANLVQDLVCEVFSLASGRVRLSYLANDPGIYECWNIAIRQSRGRYISNANLDDRRDPDHAMRLIKLLEDTGASVASSAVEVTEELVDIVRSTDCLAPTANGAKRGVWFGADEQGSIDRHLKDFFVFGANGELIQCMNFPHCMPIWRREVHQRFGYFDEQTNGTYADFAYWLELVSQGERFVHLPEPLGLYFIDAGSHNRRSANRAVWRQIVSRHLSPGTRINFPGHVEA